MAKNMSTEKIAEALKGKGYKAYREDEGNITVLTPDKMRFIVAEDGHTGRGRHYRQGQLAGNELDVFQRFRSNPDEARQIAESLADYGTPSGGKSWGDLLG